MNTHMVMCISIFNAGSQCTFVCIIYWPNTMNSGASTCQLGVAPSLNIALTSFYCCLLPHLDILYVSRHCHRFVINDLFYQFYQNDIGLLFIIIIYDTHYQPITSSLFTIYVTDMCSLVFEVRFLEAEPSW